ncbi:HAUS augmin-like complex subunit 6 isoform X2 [Petromyzon marinus]|uniref:HAUS augmin-like complex subunit 6 isoform X2 n=1 Tax=Petromyzon marinus TaxID=7757 RepID=A0AAJ7X808_PETMA|nr:HAUS augmin-like complex subunit 6 isoform X2 [Petromyzon marinus]
MAECDLGGKGARIWSMLLLLGWEAPPGLRVSMGPDMFVKPNKCAFENITYFLFCKLNPVLAKERFRLCMPIVDKKMEQMFRKTCSFWLRDVSEEKQSCGFPQIQHSLFISPGGNLFINVMYHFCIYVLEKQILKFKNVDEYRSRMIPPASLKPRLNGMEDVVAERLIADTALLRKKTLQRVHRMQVDIEESWNNNRSLDKECKELTVQIQKQEKKMAGAVKDCGYVLANEEGCANFTDAAVEECLARKTEENKMMLKEVRAMWATLEGTLKALEPSVEAVDAVLSGEADRYQLDGAAVDVKIPRMLLALCEKEIKRQRVHNVFVAGRLDMLSVLQLHRLALRHYMDELRIMGLPDLTIAARDLYSQAASLATCLAEMQTLRITIAGGVLPDLNKAVAELDTRWQEKKNKGFNPLIIQPAFTLLPAFPPLSLELLEEDSDENVPSLFPYPRMEKQIHLSAKAGSLQAEVDLPMSSGLKTPRSHYPSHLNQTESSEGDGSRASQQGLRHKPNATMTAPAEKRTRKGETRLRRPAWKSQAKDFNLEAKTAMERAHDKLAEQIAEAVTLGMVGDGACFALEGAEDPATAMLSNPFIIKSELQRTPVQMVSDVRATWREDTDGQLLDETPDSFTDADGNKLAPISDKKSDNSLFELGQEGDQHTAFPVSRVWGPQPLNAYRANTTESKRISASDRDAVVNGNGSLLPRGDLSMQPKKEQPLNIPLNKMDDGIGSLRDYQNVLECVNFLQEKSSLDWEHNRPANAVGNQASTKHAEYFGEHAAQEHHMIKPSHSEKKDCNDSNEMYFMSPFTTTADRLKRLFQKPVDKSVDYSPIRSPLLMSQTPFPALFSEYAGNNASFSPQLMKFTDTITLAKLPLESQESMLKSNLLDLSLDLVKPELVKPEMDRQVLPEVSNQPEADGCTKTSTASFNSSDNWPNRWPHLGKEKYEIDDAAQFGILNETMPVLGDSHSSPGSLCAEDSMEDNSAMVAAAEHPWCPDNGGHDRWQDDTRLLLKDFTSKQVPAISGKKAIADEMEAVNEPRESELDEKSSKKAFCLDDDFLNSFALDNEEMVHGGRLSLELAITPNLLDQLDLDFPLPQIYLDRFAGRKVMPEGD